MQEHANEYLRQVVEGQAKVDRELRRQRAAPAPAGDVGRRLAPGVV